MNVEKEQKKCSLKSLLPALSVVLACLILGLVIVTCLTTMADARTNTFAAEGLLEPNGSFILKEHKAILKDDGSYTLGEAEVAKNSYIIEGTTIFPKDPFVRVMKLTEGATAYLFVEIVNELGEGLVYEVDTDNWTRTNLSGPNRGEIYVYRNGAEIAGELGNTAILKGNEMIISGDVAGSNCGALIFFGYLLQTGDYEDYHTVWADFYSCES